MLMKVVRSIAVAAVTIGYPAAPSQAQSKFAPLASLPHKAVLNHYCVTCHNEKLKTAGLMLDKMDLENVSAGAEVWEKVVRKLRTGAMPPAGMPRPDKAAYDSFATYLETALDRAAEAKPNPGRPAAIHRLNRAEYQNAIRDLLAIDVDAIDVGGGSLLPADDSAYGFDNISSALSLSPVLLERYLSAARKISRLAVGDPAMHPFVQTYNSSPLLMQDERMNSDFPIGSRGGIAVHHYFPLDGEYVLRINLQRSFVGTIRGLDEAHQLDVRLDGAKLKQITVGGKEKGKAQPKGKYDAPPEAEEQLEVRFSANAGPRLVAVTFPKETWEPEGAFLPFDSKPESIPRLSTRDFPAYNGGNPGVDSVSIDGPYNPKGPGDTPSRRKIFLCRPTGAVDSARANDEETCAKKILSTLARRAYRRPPTDDDIQDLIAMYKTGRSKSGFDAGIEMAVEGMLVSPSFLFRVERDPDPPRGTATDTYSISDLELASRLSFFLWSSLPDDQLLDLAVRGKLRNSEVLEQQVRRMLNDPRSKALAENFASEWLSVRNLPAVLPDADVFPDFDDNLREAFLKETELFMESNLHEDRSLLNLLNADYTFVNERLAKHYGIPNIYGSEFRRVTLTDDARRGLLGQGSILMVTSYANRTAPTIRGKWLLENILGAPPPPPPPNVPSLKENAATKLLTMRQRMEQHRQNPVCASCHARMDPLGFALENFDGIGAWRTTDASNPIDASAVLLDGTKLQGPVELRKVLLSQPEQFVIAFTEKFLTYALGRGVEYYDAPAVRKIVREAAPGGYRWSALTLGVVKSVPFQMRKSATATATAGLR
jgi:mono/diheme cytochrome c family protein